MNMNKFMRWRWRWRWRWTSSLSGFLLVVSRHRQRNFCTHQHPSYKFNPPFSSPSTKIYNIRLTNLGRVGRVHEARKLFDEMPHRDVVSYVSMITVYIKNNNLFKAEGLFRAMPERNIVADSAMINTYAKAGRMDEACRIFYQMPHRNVYSWTSLISGYFRNGHVREGQKLFNQMPGKNVVSWTAVVLGYAHNGLIDQARAIFDQTPNKNVVLWTAMIKAYIDNCQTDEALKVFIAMPQRNIYSWNIMIQGCFKDNRTEEAIGLFDSMPRRNAVSWTTMVTGLVQNASIELARQYFNQMPKKDIAAWNAMITAYAGEGLMAEASELFHTMPQRDIVSWNAVIGGYAKGLRGPKGEAFKHLILLLQCCFRPNECTITSVLISCEDCLGLSQIHTLAVRLGFGADISLTNALITMYARCGDLGYAQLAFDTLETKDIVSWTAMMLAYSSHGFGAHAIENFARMLRLGIKPDEITFVAVLTACSHTGLVSKGWRFFNSMMHAYKLEPRAEHYACLVDVLGRAGQVDKALKLVCEMPPDKRDAAVLGALLGACKLHGDDVVAKEIGQKVIDLEPSESGGYVVLANVFAACGKWEEAAQVRRQMKGKAISKIPGFSEVYVKGSNHVFYAGDGANTDFNDINEMLRDKLLPEMKASCNMDQFNI
ncbi:pentatricopeptide repeat-containing protein At2g35030, mitochondrial-like [Cynara cardunculus var. scolymus]|uniref:Pentatricopeptide repeat-containing protein n=1 Tax=Cynara cardunculus var. scolymus TaxID=59895 RepID=A0A118JS41_CYNCS|nr:pentatricopeptide repeat-containing protein At2g35030, mitochondrial-like [Cynara cardunculus var. scolymus]KVH88509.1 hypothetical protein Ccrd_026669 [Cynara cardunculus var. scolymus]